jgi:hypothetical protein
MTTVFLSGSRSLTRLSDRIRIRLQAMIDQEFTIILGDANGADKAMQAFLADQGYRNVTVFCAGSACRNNLGQWTTMQVDVSSHLKGRDFYAQKDKEMAARSDYGFVLWDGKSSGSISNAIELVQRNKPVVVYLAASQEFVTVKTREDIGVLLANCQLEDYRAIIRKTKFDKAQSGGGAAIQQAFSL